MMKSFLQKNHRVIFYCSWLLLSTLQACLTQLQDDEAYYWVYSKFLSWGYFDHPPMIALLIKAGTIIFPGELGVRLLFIILSTLTLIITEKLIEEENHILFYAICFSLPVLQIAGFIAVPDIPLIFFTSLFFLAYRFFIQKQSLTSSILLGITMSCLLYSKYHGILVIFFALLSNSKLLKRYGIYISGITAFLFFLPHLLWQYHHDWISFKYHLFERNTEHYNISVTIEYIFGQFLLMGPIASVVFFVSMFFYRPKMSLEKAFQFTAAGIFIFFLISTLKGRVEANWTSPVIIPAILLTHSYLQQQKFWRISLYKLLPLTIVLVLIFRICMVIDILPVNAFRERFHEWKNWPKQLKEKTHNLPVVFKSSYQRASQYWFHTGQLAYSLNDYRERMNNYNFWPIEDSILGKTVYVMDIHGLNFFTDSIQARMWKVGFSRDSGFYSFSRLWIKCEHFNSAFHKNDSLILHLRATMPEYYNNYLLHHPEIDEPIIVSFFKGKEWLEDINLNSSLQAFARNSMQQIIISPHLEKGTYVLLFAVKSSAELFTRNSEKISVIVK
jgi:hypothetical protein